jgi:hypothetical protein
MSTLLTTLLIVLAVGLLVGAVLVFRSSELPWPMIGLSAFTSGVCFTVGGDTGANLSGPDLALVVGAVAGVATVASAILALTPHDVQRARPSRLPMLLSAIGTVVGAVGLVISLLTS